jgi:hypothetical protein
VAAVHLRLAVPCDVAFSERQTVSKFYQRRNFWVCLMAALAVAIIVVGVVYG